MYIYIYIEREREKINHVFMCCFRAFSSLVSAAPAASCSLAACSLASVSLCARVEAREAQRKGVHGHYVYTSQITYHASHFKDHHNLLHYSPLLKKPALDK